MDRNDKELIMDALRAFIVGGTTEFGIKRPGAVESKRIDLLLADLSDPDAFVGVMPRVVEVLEDTTYENLIRNALNYYERVKPCAINKINAVRRVMGDVKKRMTLGKEYNHNILERANDIVYNRSEEETRQYGDFAEVMQKTADMYNTMTGQNISAEDTYKFMIVHKLVREGNAHKEDNLLDLCAYAGQLNKILHK